VTTKSLVYPKRDEVLESIHKAQFQRLPAGYRKLTAADVDACRKDRRSVSWMPRQETGVRPSVPVPYQLYASGKLSGDRKAVELAMEAQNEFFGAKSAGSPFHVYAPRGFRQDPNLRTRAYAVEAGKQLTDAWALDGFENGVYHLCVCGPNGFLREITGSAEDPLIDVHCEYDRKPQAKPTGDLAVTVTNRDPHRSHAFQIVDHAYKRPAVDAVVKPGSQRTTVLRLSKSFFWYDFTVRVAGFETYARRCAGRVETGKLGFSDPAMGNVTE
jgi:phospholipase C